MLKIKAQIKILAEFSVQTCSEILLWTTEDAAF